MFDEEKFYELMSYSKERLVMLFLKSEELRHKQAERLEKQERDMAEYDDILLNKWLNEDDLK